jgi:hypothetical protein
MATIYVARSKSLSEWGGDVGLSKNLFKLGVFDGTGKSAGKDAVAALNEEKFAGVDDWALLKAEDAGEIDEADAVARLAKKQPVVDPKYYPRIKGATGIFRIKPKDIENSMLVQRAMAGEQSLNFTLKPADIAAFLIRNAGVGE